MISCQPMSEWTEFPGPIDWFFCHAPFEVFLFAALMGTLVAVAMWFAWPK